MIFPMRENCGCVAALTSLVLSVACSGSEVEGTGRLEVLLESEDVIVAGLEAGSGLQNIRDGWAVAFDKYLVAIGDIRVRFSTDSDLRRKAEDVFVADLTKLPPAGSPLWSIDGLKSGRWEFLYSTPLSNEDSIADSSLDDDDHERLVDERWTYWIEGRLTNEAGQACPPVELATPGDREPNGSSSRGNACYDASQVRFAFGVQADVRFGPCEIEGIPGFSVVPETTRTVGVTLHGDHLFFNGFPEGSEGGIVRLAQWLADCDLDLDGTVTNDELGSVTPALLPEIDERFQLGGSPITPLDTMEDYVSAQLMTQGHFQGEGECPLDSL